ncbi:MAG: hypothetical protein AB7Q16_25610 [Vicinamibacterales bacterium]
MAPHAPVHVIAVYSPEPRTSDFFKRALDSDGFAAFTAPADMTALEEFVRAIQPAAIVFDIGATTDEHWEALLELCKRSPVGDIPMVITTGERKPTPGRADDRLVLTPVIEMFTHRNDLRDLRTAVRQVLRGSQPERWQQSGSARRAS